MSILENLRTKQTGQRMPMRTGVSADIDLRETGNSKPMGFGTNDEYEMSLVVSCTFWAGSASKEQAFSHAKEALIHSMYADILPQLSEAQSAVIGQDYETALTLLAKIKDTVIGVR